MTNHPLDDAAKFDHERASSCIPQSPSIADDQIEKAAIDMVITELRAARAKFGPFKSAHEGYAVMLEEVDELWDEIKKKDSVRSQAKMLAEAKQVAAMGMRFMVDVCRQALVQETLKRIIEHVSSCGGIKVVDGSLELGPERRKGKHHKTRDSWLTGHRRSGRDRRKS